MFWGLTIEPGKHYTQTVEESFHVSMAAIETRDHVSEFCGEKTGLVQVVVKHEKTEFLVCSLYYGTVFQQALDLNFTEGEEVTFFTEGRGIVHLTGFLVREEPLDIDQDMLSMEDASSSDDDDISVSDEDEADISLHQLANQDLSDEDSEEENWAPDSAKRKKPKSKAKKDDQEEETLPVKRRRTSSNEASRDWIMYQPTQRKSAQKARKVMAIAMATKHGLDLHEDSDTEDDVPGTNEKINKSQDGSATPDKRKSPRRKKGLDLDEDSDTEDDVPMRTNEKINKPQDESATPENRKSSRGKKDTARRSVEMITNIDDDEDDADAADGKDLSRSARRRLKKKKEAAAAATDDDIQIVRVTKGKAIDVADDDDEDVPIKKKAVKKTKGDEDSEEDESGDDEDYEPDKAALKKSRVESESESSSDEEGPMEEEEFEGSDTDEDDEDFEGDEDEEEEEENSDSEEEEEEDGDEENDKKGVANGHMKKKQQQIKQADKASKQAGSNKKANKKNPKKDEDVEGMSSDKENLTGKKKDATPKGKESAKKEPKKTQLKEQKKVATVKPTKHETRKGGVAIKDTKEGNGKVATKGKLVKVYYRGKLVKNNKEFDANTTGKGFAFRLGAGEVIAGWDTGVVGMKVGGKRQITVPPSQGYGKQKTGPIPPNSTLVFDVELKSVS